MFKKIVLILLIGTFWGVLPAQNTLLTGKISNHHPYIEGLDLFVNHRYLDNDVSNYESNILEDGSFAFAISIQEPQLVKLIYARNTALLYLEPNDSLHINFDANSFKFSFQFEGLAAHNNTYLTEYLKKHPRELDPFQYLQYKSGTYWYKIDPRKDREMRHNSKKQYVEKTTKTKQAALMELGFFDQNNKDQLSDDFKEFLEAEIIYEWAYHLLLYGNVYKGVHALDSSFFEIIKKIETQNSQIGSHWYRMYLEAYLNQRYVETQTEKETNPYITKYHLAEQELVGMPLAYIQSEMINWGFHKKLIDTTLPVYNDYIEKNPYVQFDEKIVRAYQKAVKTAIGTSAPEFVIVEPDTTDITLSGMRGKVVVLNFWASWCRPCIKKMNEWKPIQNEFENEIEFVHISFDRSADQWVQALVENKYKGIHVLAEGNVKSDIAQSYDVRAIPQYFIIDKEGRFAEKPSSFSPESLRKSLISLNTAN